MRIAHYMPGMWEPGGVATYIDRVARAQSGRGDEVAFLDDRPLWPPRHATLQVAGPEDLVRRCEALGVEVLHAHATVDPFVARHVPLVRTLHGHQPYCPSGSKYLERSGRPCDRPYSPAGCLWGHVVDHCGSVRPAKLVADFRRTWRDQEALRGIPIVAVSGYLRDQLVRAGFRPDQVHVLGLPGPDARPASPPPEGTPRFLFLGRLVPQKGVAWLLHAVARTSGFDLDVAGDGHQAHELAALARRLGLADRVTFHGWVPPERVEVLMAESRALVFPSVWQEPAGLAMVEASARGRAVVASRVGGVPEFVAEGETALLVEPQDVEGLAAALTRLAQDRPLACRLGAEGLRRANSHDAAALAAELDRLYRTCVGAGAQ